MVQRGDELEKHDLGGGILVQHIGSGEYMTALHWDMEDQSEVKMHSHPNEQFGYVIKGGYKFFLGAETYILKAGDSYFVPPNVEHGFITIGQAEAIDIFYPVRDNLPM